MKIHFIAIGGSVMHQLALTLQAQGHTITGSDDDIFEPSYSNLKANGLLPEKLGWFPERVDNTLDFILLGMHAKIDNPELLKAQSLNLKIYSYPEYIYTQAQDRQRIVVAGSCGKTTITAMIIHLLEQINKPNSYLVGGKLIGQKSNLKIESEAPIFIFEGDEYPTSVLNPQPKFLNYQPHIALITGIDWDHVNIYPTPQAYVQVFQRLIDGMPKMGHIIYNNRDKNLKRMMRKFKSPDRHLKPAVRLKYRTKSGKTWITNPVSKMKYPFEIFGAHNVNNLGFVLALCPLLGIDETTFFEAMVSFKGVEKRFQYLGQKDTTDLFLDFAHTPTKLQAAIKGLKAKAPTKKQIVCYELHSYSNLNPTFLERYRKTYEPISDLFIYYNPVNLERKGLKPLSTGLLASIFKTETSHIFTDIEQLETTLLNLDTSNKNLTFISSGNFDNLLKRPRFSAYFFE